MYRRYNSREEYDDALARWLADVILAELRRRAAERAPRDDTPSDESQPRKAG